MKREGTLKTIGVDLWGDQQRGIAPNRATCIRSATELPRRTLPELFAGAYRFFVDRCRAVEEPGIAVIAVDERRGRAQGLLQLRARVERHVAGIVGRHDACDLFLTASDRLALRHLAFVLDPPSSFRPGGDIGYRVLDLRTTDGFQDEHGRPLRGMRCEGPAVLRCAGHALFVLPLGDPTDWPASPDDAWACLPERVYFDEMPCDPQGSLPRIPLQANKRTRQSMIFRTHGPRETSESLVESGDIVGMLELTGKAEQGTIRIGRHELRDGVLLGRYPRCDGARLVDDPSLSRVHALLIQIGDSLLMIDTASRNGTRLVGADDTRVIHLDNDSELELGKSTRAVWRWLS